MSKSDEHGPDDPVSRTEFDDLSSRTDENSRWIAGAQRLVRKTRRAALAGLATLVVNVGAIGGAMCHAASERGALEERAAQRQRAFDEYKIQVDRELDRLERDVRELRKLAGLPADLGVTFASSSLGHEPSDSIPLSSLLADPDRDPIPMSCTQVRCTTSLTCQDAFTNCHYCYNGFCSSILPAQPIPSDAGVDGAIDAK